MLHAARPSPARPCGAPHSRSLSFGEFVISGHDDASYRRSLRYDRFLTAKFFCQWPQRRQKPRIFGLSFPGGAVIRFSHEGRQVMGRATTGSGLAGLLLLAAYVFAMWHWNADNQRQADLR